MLSDLLMPRRCDSKINVYESTLKCKAGKIQKQIRVVLVHRRT